MIFNVLTLFPEMVYASLNHSILGKAMEKGLIQMNLINFRDYTTSKHKSVDDYPYGGGAGMVIQVQPVVDAYEDLVRKSGKTRLIYLTPQGKTFNQSMAESFAKEKALTFLCGHYEGIDERIIEHVVTDQVSLGDFVLTGGEVAVAVIIDAVARLVPDVLKNSASTEQESFHNYLLEYPHYTRPAIYKDMPVPEVLLSGHHAKIKVWRREQSLIRTYERRPDLLDQATLSDQDREFLETYKAEKKK